MDNIIIKLPSQTTPVIRVATNNGSIVTAVTPVSFSNAFVTPNYTPSANLSQTPIVKVYNNNGSFVQAASILEVTANNNNNILANYSTTAQMLANDATTYANSISIITNLNIDDGSF